MNIKKSEAGVTTVELHDKEGVEITNKSFSLKKLKESNTTLQYGSFLKSATLLANVGTEKEIDGHITTNDIEIKPIQVLSDADLFKACGGRTAHKGARHGLNLTGKLQRIAEQERELLERMKGKQDRYEVFREPATKKQKKRPLVELNSSKDDTSDDSRLPIDTDSDYILKSSRKRKKRDKKQELQLIDKISGIGLDEEMSVPDEPEPTTEREEDEQPYNGTPVRKKQKSKRVTDKLSCIQEADQSSDETPQKPRKTKKGKRKLDEDDDEMESKEANEKQKKKKPKKVKLDESYEASGDEDDIASKINKEQRAVQLLKAKKKNRKAKKKEKERAKATADYFAEACRVNPE